MSKIRRLAITLAATAGLTALWAEAAQAAPLLSGMNHCHPVH